MMRGSARPLSAERLLVQGIEMELVRKPTLRTLRIRVYASDGHIRVTAPDSVRAEVVLRFVEDRLPWIRRKLSLFTSRVPKGDRDPATGETERYEGKEYRLRVVEGSGRQSVTRTEDGVLELRVRPRSKRESRERLLRSWYRDRLKEKLTVLFDRWEGVIGVSASEWRIKAMRTRWGSCNTAAKRIWLNLDLARKPVHCLEYVVVHELVHLLERSHDARFKALMDTFLPEWRAIRKALNYGSISHEE